MACLHLISYFDSDLRFVRRRVNIYKHAYLPVICECVNNKHYVLYNVNGLDLSRSYSFVSAMG